MKSTESILLFSIFHTSNILFNSIFYTQLCTLSINYTIQVDAEKMSKSKGNFLMLLECVEEFTADATRFALADAGTCLSMHME